MTEPAATVVATDVERLDERVARGQLATACEEVRRAWWYLLAIDAVIASVLLEGGSPVWLVVPWFAALQLTQYRRRRLIAGMVASPPADPAGALVRVGGQWTLLGLFRAAAIVLAAATGSEVTHLLSCLITVGLVVGALATSGGAPIVIHRWVVVTFAAIIATSVAKLHWHGLIIGVLALYLMWMVLGYTRRMAEHGADAVRSALELERERDLLAQANLAVTRMADELRSERDRASEANEVTSRFLASASHDLRQPLYAMSLNTSALGDVAARLHDAQLDRVEQGLRRALQQCRSLLDQLLDISRLESGTIEVRLEAVDVANVLRGMQTAFESQAAEKGLACRIEIDDGAVHFAHTDAMLLERLLGNLLHNAVKFTDAGHVGAAIVERGGEVVVEIVDTGPGIAAENQARVFDEFFQVDNPARDRSRGLGLGLSIVRRLAALLKARVELHSTLGAGTRVRVVLPHAAAPGASHPIVDTPVQPTTPLPPGGARVLVIDDEVGLLDDIRLALEAKGWVVDTASDAMQAVAFARSHAPDVVVADHRLANGNTGLEAVRALEASIGHVVAVIVTGDTAPSRIAEAAAAGFPVLHKPLDGDELDRALRAALAVRSTSEAGVPSPSSQGGDQVNEPPPTAS